MVNLIIIGTSHIAKESVAQVRKVIEDVKPAVVALELDSGRAHALLSKKEGKLRWCDIKKIGFKGFLFSIIGGYVERKLGERVGTVPGSEMKAAIFAARKIGAQVALVDQDISVTLKRFSQVLSWREKLRLVGELFYGVLGFGQKITFDLAKVPEKETIKKLTKEVKKKYPNVYRVLVAERNLFMAKKLIQICRQMPEATIVAVVGAGHEGDIKQLVERSVPIPKT